MRSVAEAGVDRFGRNLQAEFRGLPWRAAMPARPLAPTARNSAETATVHGVTTPLPKEPHIIDAKLKSGRLLLISADVGDGRSRNAGVEPSRVPIGEHEVRHGDPCARPARDRSAGPEVDVVWVCHHDQRTRDLLSGITIPPGGQGPAQMRSSSTIVTWRSRIR